VKIIGIYYYGDEKLQSMHTVKGLNNPYAVGAGNYYTKNRLESTRALHTALQNFCKAAPWSGGSVAHSLFVEEFRISKNINI
jgi:hypothetical protein